MTGTRRLIVLVFAAALVVPAAAQRRRAIVPGAPPARTVTITDDFTMGTRGWVAGFADYSPANEDLELDSGIRALPPELSVAGTGFMIEGHNRSDDLFMFLKKRLTQIDGIRANQRYEITYSVKFASNAGGESCAGIGGHPGLSVYMKVGASGQEPTVALDDDDHYRVSVDKGNQDEGGAAASVAGNISTGSSNCSSSAPFQSLDLQHRHTSFVQSNAFAELWLLVGTDSGFEGKTTLYYQLISVTLRPIA
jgi:hypothetical protein